MSPLEKLSVKVGFTGLYIILGILSLKHKLWVPIRNASINTHKNVWNDNKEYFTDYQFKNDITNAIKR